MDAAGLALYHALALAARATSTTATATSTTSATSTASATSSAVTVTRPPVYKIVGICLAVCSGLFIGVSFVIKKIGLLKANVQYHEEAGEGYGYLKNAWWWLGMSLMILGEICNFVAYAFTDAILVTPLGALSVVITTILSWVFLKERLSFVGWVSCFLCIVGSIVITLNAPEQAAVADIQEMQHYVISVGFLSYAIVIIVGCLIVIFFVAPKYGKKSMLVYLSVCSLIGGLSVVATQGLGAAILAQINGHKQFNQWFLYILFVFVICTLLTEIIYLNKALNLFNAALVTPTYYVYFTSSTIVASAVLFQGFHGTAIQIIDVVLGFVTICSGVVLLQLAKSAKDVPDSKVFSGDLDQVRTVAEVVEPEYEPRADTLRGGAGIVRAMSRVRTKRQADEAKRIHEERMQQVGEADEYEWDGLRRRKTTSTRSGGSVVRRAKSVHPPLGMSHFPDDVSEPDSEVHPGFFGRIGRKSAPPAQAMGAHRRGVSPVPLDSVRMVTREDSDGRRYSIPPGTRHPSGVDPHEDTSYKSPSAGRDVHIQWGGDTKGEQDRASSQGSGLAPPRPPPHGARRHFSFQNVFNSKRAAEAAEDTNRSLSRGASYTSHQPSREYPTTDGTTEEERLGLVHGDSERHLSRFEEEPEESDEWQVTSGSSTSPEQVGGSADRSRQRPGDPFDDNDDDDEFYNEPLRSPTGEHGGKHGGPAFV